MMRINKILIGILIAGCLAFTLSKSPKLDYNLPPKSMSICTSDIDLDGDMDIIVGHARASDDENPSLTILKNDGNGYFNHIDTSFSFCGYQ